MAIHPRCQVKRNVDELCDLPAEVGFAAAYNTGTEARTCFNRQADYLESEHCSSCQHHGLQRTELRATYWTSKALAENRSHLPLCQYEFNTGVMVVKPFSRHDFRVKVRTPKRDALQRRLGSRRSPSRGAPCRSSLVRCRRSIRASPRSWRRTSASAR